ncbi:MAG: ATP-binding protein [archaeon YNP-WB-062]|jgi:DNA helicase HerA-like ATPase|nr:ATP-binding protein [Candidatus Culexarchaeum yellowstonense]
MAKPIGLVLSGSTSRKAIAQLYEDYEGKVHEGELCFIHLPGHKINLLCRINKIIPFSEFFEEGDAWSEARRKMAQIPSEISRKYYTLELEILGEMRGGHLSEVTIPPAPGNEVLKMESEKEILEVMRPEGEDRVFIEFGRLFGYKEIPLFLDIDAIPMHLSILGVTGSGKSYTVGYLIEQLSEINIKGIKTALTTIIIDANGDYIDYYEAYHIKHQKIGNYADVVRFVLNNSPVRFNRGVKLISLDLDIFEPREVAELIITYYTGGYLNELQVAGLEMALRRLKEDGYSMTSLLLENRSFEGRLLVELERAKEDRLIHDQTLNAIRRALNKFRSDVVDKYELIAYRGQVTLSSDLIDSVTNPRNPALIIIDFSADGAPGASLQLKQLIVAYITKLLLKKFTEYKMRGSDRILLLVIEEAQNYCPNLETYPIGYSLARDNLAQIATQGRKFGLSLCLVSQRPSFVDQIVLSMVNTFIIHRISAGDVPFVKKVAGGLPEVIEDKLTSLATGRAIITGQMNKLGFPIIVDIPERKVKPTIGKISVSKILTG